MSKCISPSIEIPLALCSHFTIYGSYDAIKTYTLQVNTVETEFSRRFSAGQRSVHRIVFIAVKHVPYTSEIVYPQLSDRNPADE